MHATPTADSRMPLADALRVLADLRRDEIVVATMGSAREWPRLSQHPLDFQYLPSAMGHAPALGLGMALAQPEREVWVLNGDGCMLMSLGSLVTIAAGGASNLTLIVLENSLYEVTGGQATAASAAQVDFAGLARAAGLHCAHAFDTLESWRQAAAGVLAQPGPRFIVLRVAPVQDYALPAPSPMPDRIRQFRAALGV